MRGRWNSVPNSHVYSDLMYKDDNSRSRASMNFYITIVKMFVASYRILIQLIIMTQHTCSIPSLLDSSDHALNSDLSLYSSETPAEMPFANNEGPNVGDDLNLLDDIYSSVVDSTSFFPVQVNDDSLPTSYDLTSSDSSASCGLGRKRSGDGCEVLEEFPPRQIPNPLGSLNPETNALRGDVGGEACPGGWNLCCDGPARGFAGWVFEQIDECTFGTRPRDIVLLSLYFGIC